MNSGRTLRAWWVVFAAALTVRCIEPRKHHESGEIPPADPGTVALGQPCQGFEACAPVPGQDVGCRCTDRDSVPVCVVDAREGDPCSGPGVFAPCRAGTVCSEPADAGATWVCAALGQPGDVCDLGGCADGAYCDETAHCALATAALGEPCRPIDAWSCKAPNVCDLDTSVCVPPTPIGGHCASIIGGRSACGASAFCSLSIGEAEGVCDAALADGELCWVDEQCLSRICFGGACGRGYATGSYVSCAL